MRCEYCNGTGSQHNAVRGDSPECMECQGSGIAKCLECGNDADGEDMDGDYICGTCMEDQ